MAEWYYAENDTRHGPVPEAEMARLVATRAITAATLVWRDGLAGWEAASAHFAFGGAATPPPLSPAPPVGAQPSQSPSRSPAMQQGDTGPDGLYINAPSRTFGEAISTCFSKYVTFSGRASRSEYWFFVLFLLLLGIVASVIDAGFFPGSIETGGPVNGLVSLVTFLPSMAVSWRRLHDTNRSGWWIGGMWIAIALLVGIAIAVYGDGTSASAESAYALIPIFAVAFFVYAIVLLVFFCSKGTLGPNRFG